MWRLVRKSRLLVILLTPNYTLSRYPGRKSIKYTKQRAKHCLNYSKKIVECVKGLTDP